jgi:hypothetical protein
MGGSSATGKSETVPWEKAQPYILDFLQQSQDLSQDPVDLYPGQRISGQSQDTLVARDMIRDLTEGGGSPVNAMNTFLGEVMGGEFMGEAGQNPLLDEQFGVMSDRIGEKFQQITMPTINTRFAGAGRSGQAGAGRARGRADETLARELGDLGTNIYYGDYERRMGDRFKAAGLAPAGQTAAIDAASALRGVGTDEESFSQRLLDDAIQRFEYGEQEPEARLDRYGARIQQGTSGFSTTTSQQSQGGGGGETAQIITGVMSLILGLAGAAV